MMPPNLVITAMLKASPGVTALTGNRIYSPNRAPGYHPEQGSAISHFVRGGPAPSLYTPIIKPSIQITGWGATAKMARDVHSAAYAVLQGCEQQFVTVEGVAILVYGAKAETFPEDVTDPETGWRSVTNFFELSMQAN